MNKFYFSTVVSDAYLTKALVLHKSLLSCCKDFHLFILCVEEQSLHILQEMKLSNVTLLELWQIEDEALLSAKSARIRHEYYWTLKPAVLFYVMNAYPEAQYYAHIDSDLYFFSDPAQIFAEKPGASLFLTDHNNSQRFLYTYNLYGRYNTGFVGCKNDSIGRSAVAWWKWKCIECCSIHPNIYEKTFGDQRYVERWPSLFGNIHVVRSVGANVAIWNIEKLNIRSRNGELYADKDKLIFYHFSGLSMYSSDEFNLTWFFPIEEHIVNMIYLPYMQQLSQISNLLQAADPNINQDFKDRGTIPDKHYFKL